MVTARALGRPQITRRAPDRDEPSGVIITVPTPGSAPPLFPLRSEHERRNDRHPTMWHRHRPLTPVTGPPPAMRAARPLNCPLRDAHRGICPR